MYQCSRLRLWYQQWVTVRLKRWKGEILMKVWDWWWNRDCKTPMFLHGLQRHPFQSISCCFFELESENVSPTGFAIIPWCHIRNRASPKLTTQIFGRGLLRMQWCLNESVRGSIHQGMAFLQWVYEVCLVIACSKGYTLQPTSFLNKETMHKACGR